MIKASLLLFLAVISLLSLVKSERDFLFTSTIYPANYTSSNYFSSNTKAYVQSANLLHSITVRRDGRVTILAANARVWEGDSRFINGYNYYYFDLTKSHLTEFTSFLVNDVFYFYSTGYNSDKSGKNCFTVKRNSYYSTNEYCMDSYAYNNTISRIYRMLTSYYESNYRNNVECPGVAFVQTYRIPSSEIRTYTDNIEYTSKSKFLSNYDSWNGAFTKCSLYYSCSSLLNGESNLIRPFCRLAFGNSKTIFYDGLVYFQVIFTIEDLSVTVPAFSYFTTQPTHGYNTNWYRTYYSTWDDVRPIHFPYSLVIMLVTVFIVVAVIIVIVIVVRRIRNKRMQDNKITMDTYPTPTQTVFPPQQFTQQPFPTQTAYPIFVQSNLDGSIIPVYFAPQTNTIYQPQSEVYHPPTNQ